MTVINYHELNLYLQKRKRVIRRTRALVLVLVSISLSLIIASSIRYAPYDSGRVHVSHFTTFFKCWSNFGFCAPKSLEAKILNSTTRAKYAIVSSCVKGVGISDEMVQASVANKLMYCDCLLYTSPSPRDRQKSRMPSSA